MNRSSGFSLVEMMCSTALGCTVVAATMTAYVPQYRTLKNQGGLNERNENMRSTLAMMVRDIRMVGYGLSIEEEDLPQWITWMKDRDGQPVIADTNPKIVEGAGSQPDTIYLCGATGSSVASMVSGAEKGSDTIFLSPGESANFNTSDRGVIYVGRSETARIVSVIGNMLVVSTHPSADRPLRYGYPAGTPVEPVEVVSYACETDTTAFPHKPHLLRHIVTSETSGENWQRMVGSQIDGLQFELNGNVLRVELTGRSTFSMPGKMDATERTAVARAFVTLRNRKYAP